MADVTVTLTGDEAKLLRSLEKVIQKEREMAIASAKAGEETVRASEKAQGGLEQIVNAQVKAFGDDALGLIKNYTIGLLSLTTIIGGVKKAIAEVDQAYQEAAQRHKDAETGMGILIQKAGGDPKKLQELVNQSKELFKQGGAKSLDEANVIVGLAKNQKDRDLYASLYGIVGDVGMLARSANAYQTSIGEKETGGIRDIISKAMKALPGKADELLSAIAESGGGISLRAIGGRDEELLAATALMTKNRVDLKTSASGISRLMDLMQKEGFAGLGLGGGLQKMKAMFEAGKALSDKDILSSLVQEAPAEGRKRINEKIQHYRQSLLTDEEIVSKMSGGEYGGRIAELKARRTPYSEADKAEFLGRPEAKKAYEVLTGQYGKFQNIISGIDEAQKNDLVGGILSSRDDIPMIDAARKARIAENKKKLIEEKEGVLRNLSNAILNEMDVEKENRGQSRFSRNFDIGVLKAIRGVGNIVLEGGGDMNIIRDHGTLDEKRQAFKDLSKIDPEFSAQNLLTVFELHRLKNINPNISLFNEKGWQGKSGERMLELLQKIAENTNKLEHIKDIRPNDTQKRILSPREAK